MKKIYILSATGSLRYLDGRHQIVSKYAYSTFELAQKHSASFLERCKHSDKIGSNTDLDDDTAINIQVFELMEEDLYDV